MGKRVAAIVPGAAVLVIFLFLCANTGYAVPVTVEKVNAGGSVISAYFGGSFDRDVSVYSDYSLDTSAGHFDAFCVEPREDADPYSAFEWVQTPENLYEAVWVADQYWNNLDWTHGKTDTQILIWELALGEDFTYSSGGSFSGDGSVQDALTGLSIGTPSPYVSLMYNPPGDYVYNEGHQDYLVNARVPEPATLILMGTGLAGAAFISRRRKRNNMG